MKKKNMIIIGVIALILAVSVGYAIFSDTLTINGSATAKGDFSLSYSCEIDDSSANKESAKCKVVGSDIEMKSLFLKPNESVLFHVTVTNDGTIPAVLKEVTSPNNKGIDFKGEGDAAYVDTDYSLAAYYGVMKNGEEEAIMGDADVADANITLQPGEEIDITVVHGWVDSDMLGLESQPQLPVEGKTLTYNLTFKFEQPQN